MCMAHFYTNLMPVTLVGSVASYVNIHSYEYTYILHRDHSKGIQRLLVKMKSAKTLCRIHLPYYR